MKTFGDTLLELFEVILKRRKFFVRFVLVVTLGMTIYALVAPKYYRATVTIVPAEPPQYLNLLNGLGGLLGGASGLGRLAPGLGGATEVERYMGIVTSERSLLRVIEKFDLVRVYDITRYPREKTIKELSSNLSLESTLEGNLRIDVYDTDPQRAVDMASYIVELLNEINTELHVQNAKGSRKFIEDRYLQNIEDIDAAQDSLRLFQLKYRVLSLPEQLEASIKAGAVAEVVADR